MLEPDLVQPDTQLLLTPQQVDHLLTSWLGSEVHCTRIEALRGGLINSVLKLHFDCPPYTAVVKLNSQGTSFAGEAEGLRHLKSCGLPCPTVYLEESQGEILPYAFLLLETMKSSCLAYRELHPADQTRIERELAEVLAELHSWTRDRFGVIGLEGETDWADVFLPRLRRVRAESEVERLLPAWTLDKVDRALEIAEDALQHQGPPTLIHGDIWAANVMVDQADGDWHLSGLIDPGAQYADVEMELAYLQVFDTAGEAFFDAYTHYHPLRPGHELRRLIYWLNTYLLNVWLFDDQLDRKMVDVVAHRLVVTAG